MSRYLVAENGELESEFSAPAIEVEQPIGRFFVAAIPASVLLAVTYPDPLRLAVDKRFADRGGEWTDLPRLSGTQRPIDGTRLKEISTFISTIDATFPNTIILSVDDRPVPDENSSGGQAADDSEDGALLRRPPWRIERGRAPLSLVVPRAARLAHVVDGQHRLYAFSDVESFRQESFFLVCSVFFGLPKVMQANVFASINTNQKAVRRGMAMNLYGYNVDDEARSMWSPEKLAVFLTRRLNFDPASPLHLSVRVDADNAPEPVLEAGQIRPLTMAAVVDGGVDDMLISLHAARHTISACFEAA